MGRELTRIDEQVQLLDLESQKVKESIATQVAKRLGQTDERQTRHEAVTSQLHEVVQGTGEQSMHRDLLLDQEIAHINEQHKRELQNYEMSINLMKDKLRQNQESRQDQDGEIAVLKALVEQLMRQVKGKGKTSDPTPEVSGVGRCNNPIVIRYATGNDSYFLSKPVSLFYPGVCGSTIYSDSTELACLSRVIRRRILSRQIVIWVDCRA